MKEHDVAIAFTPKGHCELDGRGIEYLWGVSKLLFRKENSTLSNDERANNLKARVHKLLCNMSIETMKKCARRARECKLSYLSLVDEDNSDIKLHDIEKMKKDYKYKRCVLEQDKAIANKMASMIDVENVVVKPEKDHVIDLIDDSFMENMKKTEVMSAV